MIISFFSTGTGGGAAPVDYLIAREVLAYDENRNLICDDTGQLQTKIRDPLPEVLRGNPDLTRDLIDACPNKWTYTAGVISFADSDDPSPNAQQEAIELFEALAFAGLDRDQYDCLWVRHTHEGNVELHFCTPRLELNTGKALNIAPPGHENAFACLRDLMNKTYQWADPLEPERAREVGTAIEAPTRAQGRKDLHNWILDQISVGTITDRGSMIDVLTEAGFEIPRASKNYLTAKDPDTGERWRLKGEIFHDDWQAAPPGREIERGLRNGPQGTRRLDSITFAELQERYSGQCEARAGYNRNRYQCVFGLEREIVAEPHQQYQTLDEDFALDSGLERSVAGDGDTGLDVVLELVSRRGNTQDPTGENGHSNGAARAVDLPDPATGNSQYTQLHNGREEDFLHQGGAEINGSTPNSLGKRIARLRRAVGNGLRDLHTGIKRLGKTLNQQDRDQSEWIGALRDTAHEITSLVGRHIGRLSERGTNLREASRKLGHQFEISEGRRKTAERELAERPRTYETDYGLDL